MCNLDKLTISQLQELYHIANHNIPMAQVCDAYITSLEKHTSVINRLDRLAKLSHTKWGIDEQLFKVFEELGELAQAINKYRHNRITKEELTSEVADNYVMLRQLVLIFNLNEDEIQSIIECKLDKFEKKLDNV